MNFSFLIEQNIFLIIFIILTIGIVGMLIIGIVWILIIDIFKFLRREKRDIPPPKDFAKNELFFRISEEFHNQLKRGVEEEIKNNLLEFRKEIEKTSQEIIKSYQAQFRKEKEEMQRVYSAISQQIIIGGEEMRKQIKIFGQKTQEEISQLSKFNLETQKKISETAENKISQLDEVAKKEISKIEETTLKIRELLLAEIKKQSEIFSRELSQKISQIYQLSGERLREKIQKTEEEIENYKKEEFKKMDREIYRLIGEVAKKTIGKAIDLSDHERLVMEALEKAKKEIF